MAAELRDGALAPTRLTQLVRQAQDGHSQAFDVLIEHYVPAMFRLAAGIAGPDDGRDAAQEAFVAAWRDLPGLRKPEAFEAWLRRIVIHRAHNAMRSRKRRPAVPIERPHGGTIDPPAAGDFRDAVHAREALDGAFEALTPEQTSVVVLHYGSGYTLSEVAEVTQTRTGTVKSRLNAALRRLRAVVDEVEP